jgi:hypothetical protein
MMMQIVNVFSDQEHRMTLLVHHNVQSKSFKQSWKESLELVKVHSEWSVGQVIARLELAGWQIIEVDNIVEALMHQMQLHY